MTEWRKITECTAHQSVFVILDGLDIDINHYADGSIYP